MQFVKKRNLLVKHGEDFWVGLHCSRARISRLRITDLTVLNNCYLARDRNEELI